MRFGFACKFITPDGKQPFTNRSLSFKHFSALSHEAKRIKLAEVVQHNIASLIDMIRHVGQLRTDLRMFRITSELLPLYTHPQVACLYRESHLENLIASGLRAAGRLAQARDVRLSFHPGQFTVLASDRPDVVSNSIHELEYHAYCARCMGFGKTFQDFKINIHLSGRLGAKGFREAFHRLSEPCQKMLTVENDEIVSSVEDVLQLSDLCAVVIDIHHHWVMTNEYIQPEDDRVRRAIDSWRDVRPVIHYSVSRPEFVPSVGLPDQNKLSATKMQLRAHSEYYHNSDVSEWASSFSEFDVMCESKAKNLARLDLVLCRANSALSWTK